MRMDLALSEEYTFEIRTLLFSDLFLSERVALCSMLGVSIATFCVGVLAVGDTHSLLVPLEFPVFLAL